MHNHGNYIVSLGNFCRWLGQQAEELGVEIYPGFAAAEVLYHEDGSVKGVATGDMGIGKDGEKTDAWRPGMELWAKQTIFAEGCRGSLTKTLFERFRLHDGADPQTYGIGIKELWEVQPELHQPGSITHTVGWPVDTATYGGSFMYHLENNQVVVGYVIGLDYQNPYLSPFEEFQRFKTHPAIRKVFEGGRRLSYGARADRGRPAKPAAADLPRRPIGGRYRRFPQRAQDQGHPYRDAVGDAGGGGGVRAAGRGTAGARSQRLQPEIQAKLAARGVAPGAQYPALLPLGPVAGDDLFGAGHLLFRGKAPWTLRHHQADHQSLKPADECTPIAYPKPDGVLTFDRLSSVFISNTNHGEDQPPHLKLKDASVPVQFNLAKYDAPEQRYCPAGVYEIVGREEGEPKLQINAQNCVHCKTCDIKDPTQNIVWTVPEAAAAIIPICKRDDLAKPRSVLRGFLDKPGRLLAAWST